MIIEAMSTELRNTDVTVCLKVGYIQLHVLQGSYVFHKVSKYSNLTSTHCWRERKRKREREREGGREGGRGREGGLERKALQDLLRCKDKHTNEGQCA